MCYRDAVPTLNFNNIHVACLSGDNGHGKSALLDSITWALWGQSRTRTQDELIHQGLNDMMVELEFALSFYSKALLVVCELSRPVSGFDRLRLVG